MCTFVDCVKAAYGFASDRFAATQIETSEDAVYVYPAEHELPDWRNVYASPSPAFACAESLLSKEAEVALVTPNRPNEFVFLRRPKC